MQADNNTLNGKAETIEQSFDTVGLLLDFLAHWKWFILSVIVCGIASYFYVATIIPTYQIAASVYLSDDKSASKSQAMLGMADKVPGEVMPFMDQTEIAILKSKNNLIKIVDSLGLAYRYYNVGPLRDYPVYKNSAIIAELDSVSLRNLTTPIEIFISKDDNKYDVTVISKYDEGTEEQDFTLSKLPAKVKIPEGTLTLRQSPFTKKMNGTEKIRITNPNIAAARVAAGLDIGFADNATAILSMTFDSQVPQEGRDILRALIDFYNQQIIADKNLSAIQTEAFILDRLVMISSELKDVENRLKEYREEHNVANLEAQTAMNLSQQSNTESQLASVDAEREIINEIEKQVTHQDSYTTLPAVSNNEAVTQSIESYNKAVSNYRHMLETRGADHPQVQRMQTSLNQQKAQIVSNLDAAKRDIAARRRGIVSIDSRSVGALAAQPTIDKGLNEIFREQQVKVNIYTFLLQKREEIALQKTLATPTARFIDNPTGGILIAPKRSLYYGIGLLIGLLFPAAIITLRRVLFPKFNDKEELERVTKVPILGEISINNSDNDVVVGEGISTPIAELFRLLRNNINFIHAGNGKKIILLTSSVSGEGKTFVALNLAMTYALTGKKVVIVGLDIRRPVLAHVSGLSNARGVTTFLSGQEEDLSNLIHQSSFNENLYVLPAGPVPPNPNELLMSPQMDAMFNRLRADYDFVIIDSAPVGLVSDTFLIVPQSDIQLYVTRAGFSTRRSLRVLHDAINSGHLNRVYLILNGVNVAGSSYIYRKYGHYGYGTYKTYGYASGYSSATRRRKKSWIRRLLKR